MANAHSIMSLLYPELLANILTNQQTAKKSEFSAFNSQLKCLAELFARLQNQTHQSVDEPHVLHYTSDPKFSGLESFLEHSFAQQIPPEMGFSQALKRPLSPTSVKSQTSKLALISKRSALMEGGTHVSMTSRNSTIVDGVNLDEIREFARHFKMKRISLGLTQTQVGQALSATEGPAYSQSAICRFEKLDITPKSAQRIKPVLEKWLAEAEERCKQGNSHGAESTASDNSRKRKRRTSFNPQALEILNDHFERNPHPSGSEMSQISNELNYDREVIRVWFCNKRQALKNTVRRMHDVTQGSGSSTQGQLEDQSGFQRSTPTIQEEIGDIY